MRSTSAEEKAVWKMVKSPEIFARITFLRTEEGGLKGLTTAKFFGCPFLMDEQMNDCRLVLADVGPGQTVQVPITFLVPELVVDRLKVGRRFKLWHMRIIAEGEILKVFAQEPRPETGSC